uniref:Uncharacterized protein n=1 Tax=Pararge aegeria TaxID=116150 RepID=S4NH59_9NEOP
MEPCNAFHILNITTIITLLQFLLMEFTHSFSGRPESVMLVSRYYVYSGKSSHSDIQNRKNKFIQNWHRKKK